MDSRGPSRETGVAGGRSHPTLRLLAYGGERPTVIFGSVTVGSRSQQQLRLQNDTELERVLTLASTLANGLTLVDEDGNSVQSIRVTPRSNRVLSLVWCPETPGSLAGPLRWHMPQGAVQATLEVRVQGSAVAEAPGGIRTSAGVSGTGQRLSAGGGSTPTTASKARPAATAASKGSMRSLSLIRPQPPSFASPPPVARGGLSTTSAGGIDMPPAPSLPPINKTPGPTPGGSSHGGGPQTLGSRNPTPSRSFAAEGRTLDLRHVMSAESKREAGLFAWMNGEVAPLDAEPSSEGAGMEGHVIRRLLGDVLGKAYRMKKRDEAFVAMASKIQEKIEKKQLELKDPETTLSDVRMRQHALDVLTSYHPFWLTVGVQTVLRKALSLSPGDMLTLMRSSGEVPTFLRAHIQDHFLADQELAAKYRHTNLKQQFWEKLGALVLGQVLVLVWLLDRMAQRTDLPSGTPSLFRKDSAIKSSEQVLLEFLQSRMAGAGDVRHSLRVMAYHVPYVQHARDEADYRVLKPVDLRDGTRLAKLLDNLRRQDSRFGADGPGPLSAQASTSSLASSSYAASRAAGSIGASFSGRGQPRFEDLLPTMAFPSHDGTPLDESKMRINCLQLARALQKEGVNLQEVVAGNWASVREVSTDAAAKAVVEGLLNVNQRVILGILWQMAIHFKLRKNVDVRTLEREAARLRRAAAAASLPGDAPSAAATVAADEAQPLQCFNHPASQALLQWMKAVCALHGIKVHDLQWSLADGRVLAYLIHTYLPERLPLSAICAPELPSTVDEMAQRTGGTEYVPLETLREKGWTAVYEMGGCIKDDGLAASLQRAVSANFAAVHSVSEALSVPSMLGPEDYLDDNGPDELTAILYVSLLGEALLKLTAERRAAYVIMEFLRRRRRLRPEYMRASLERYKATVRRTEVAVTIQAFWRMRRERSRYNALRKAVCFLQALVRQRLARRHFQQWRCAAVVVQSVYRAHSARKQLQRARWAATVLQAAWRGYVVRKELARQHRAAQVIQQHIRAHLAQERLVKALRSDRQLHAAVVVQSAWRGFSARRRFLQARKAAVVIQAWWRRHLALEAYTKERTQVVLLQAHVRGFLARRRLAMLLRAVVCVQAAWRAALARRAAAARRQQLEAAARERAATAIQVAWRAFIARRVRLERRRQLQEEAARERAATAIQVAWRAFTARRVRLERRRQLQEEAARERAATAIQVAWRAFVARRVRLERRRQLQEEAAREQAATAIQVAWRAFTARRVRLERRRQLQQAAARERAAAAIQVAWRAHVTRRVLAERQRQDQEEAARQHAATTIQAAWRGHTTRQHLARLDSAATLIQAAWRGFAARQLAAERRGAVFLLQAAFRVAHARRAFLRTRHAVVTIQAAWRARCTRLEVELLRRQTAAATVIQAQWRMFLARRDYLRTREALVVFQAHLRGRLVRSNMQRALAGAKAAAESWQLFMEVSRHYMRATSAALRIQTLWRGYIARKTFGPALKQRLETQRRHRAATAIQKVWRGHAARKEYRAMRQALQVFGNVLVPLYRAHRQRLLRQAKSRTRECAATCIQAAVRMWLARRRLEEAVHASIQIQAAWRGHSVRLHDGQAKREARRRLAHAAAEARRQPHRRTGHRVMEALDVLSKGNKGLDKVGAALEFLEMATSWTRDHCLLVVRSGGVGALLRLMHSKPPVDVALFTRMLRVLHTISGHSALVREILNGEDCLATLSDRLQSFRDNEDVFAQVVSLLSRLTASEEHASQVSPAVLNHWERIKGILVRDADMERKYLIKLEGDKGSDTSARERTRKLLVLQQQHAALEVLISRATAGIRDERSALCDVANDQDRDGMRRQAIVRAASAGGNMPHSAGGVGPTPGAPIPGIKNTLVKDVLQRMSKPGTPVAAKRSGAASLPGCPKVAGAGARTAFRRTES